MVLTELGERLTEALRKIKLESNLDEATVNIFLKELATALLEADVNVKYVAELRNNIKKAVMKSDNSYGSERRVIQQMVVQELVKLVKPSREPYKIKKNTTNVIMFVGLQGSGKTTTCVKYAHYYQRKGSKVALVCADTFRAGAFDQLKQNATKIGVPFYGSYSEVDPIKVAFEGVESLKEKKFDLIIVDTSGRHKQENALFDEMKLISDAIKPNDTIFVIDSHIGQASYNQALAFSQTVNLGSIIVTKLDGHAKGGGALSAVSATGCPITFIGTGEHFDNFETFDPESFISRLLGMGDIKGLINTVAESIPLDKQPEMLNRISQGIFTLRDMRDQFQNVLKMGSLSQVMSMIPGMMNKLIPKGWEKEGISQIKMFITIMDSMTNAELDCAKPLTESCILRISRGSGHYVPQVKALIEQYREFSKVISKLGKLKLGKKGMDFSQLMRNPNQLLQNMQKAIDPRILKQMGGGANIMNIMKQLDQVDGMPDINELMKNFGGSR